MASIDSDSISELQLKPAASVSVSDADLEPTVSQTPPPDIYLQVEEENPYLTEKVNGHNETNVMKVTQ